MISKQRNVCALASLRQEPSGHIGAVPDTRQRDPIRMARLKPIDSSYSDPEWTRVRSNGPLVS
jgi:hypothetical protein